MIRCKDCKWAEFAESFISATSKKRKVLDVYFCINSKLKGGRLLPFSDGITLIADDSGKIVVGPDFGCVHGEPKEQDYDGRMPV